MHSMESARELVHKACSAIAESFGQDHGASGCIVLGSGFRAFADSVAVRCAVDLCQIPGMAKPSVAGHGQALILGEIEGTRVFLSSGRVHLYEGFSPFDVVMLVRAMHKIGVRKFVFTNAAGSLSPQYAPGDVVAIEDHVNMTRVNCLSGPEGAAFGERFVDMSQAYALSRELAAIEGVKSGGVYAGLLGPNYETPAEVRLLSHLGVNLVGMSTVQETLAARQLGCEVAGMSFVTNMAAGLGGVIAHEHVVDIGKKRREFLNGVLRKCATKLFSGTSH